MEVYREQWLFVTLPAKDRSAWLLLMLGIQIPDAYRVILRS
jgi:hypothetical protein